MPGQRLRALQQANPISSAPFSPLSARSTKQQQVPFSSFFANYWPSAANAEKSLCAAPLPLLLPAAGVVVVVAPWWSSSLLPRKPSNFSFHTSSPRRTAIGRITLDCIENTSNGTTTTTSSSTTTNAAAAAFSRPAAKANLAVRATEAVVASALATFLASLRLLHLFVRSSARLAANLIVLLRDDSSPRRLFPTHIRSSPPSLPLVQPFLPPSPSPSAPTSPSSLLLSPLLLLKEALATSTSLAQVSLQFRPRPDPNSTVPHASANPRLATLSQQPAYPGASPEPDHPLAAAGLPQARSPSYIRHYDPKDYFLQSPFRNRAATSAARRLPHLSAARLWNPTNSTRALPEKTIRKRRPSTPPPPSVPLSHPTLDPYSVDPSDPLGVGAGDYPLLTLPEQRQTRHSASNRNSLQVDRNAEHRISLPRSLRHSYDGRRSGDPSPTFPDPDAEPAPLISPEPPFEPRVTGLRKRGQSVSNPLIQDFAFIDKGKGKAVMEQTNAEQARGPSKDLERGPDVLPRLSNVSAGDGIGSAISSSNSSIMGEELPPDLGEEWGPQHPCFPHLNPHVPIDSPEYNNTRIIRIRRDWLIEGDLAPTFSNLYPEILDPAGLSEQEFRRIIDKLNGELIPIFSPYNWRNILDGMLGLVTGWLWDDLGFTGVKARLKRLELWIDKWNKEMEKTVGNEDITMAPRIISLRRTGYMTLDIQIPDPEIATAPSTPAGTGNMPMEPPAAVTT
ncbi:hypothetical protein CPLU01_07323 [Colletotrichum plurivorum]|uniref:Ras modification protein ERF4 n=1 Tax=Colletotrichum plurivorum TaxID=2175906 RepID=A0A8H6NEK9_9PEZI|nr:hypothetical protein CPLU01_07323 [Colletotrichum plurivorum]